MVVADHRCEATNVLVQMVQKGVEVLWERLLTALRGALGDDASDTCNAMGVVVNHGGNVESMWDKDTTVCEID